ncbi:hypothetical protein DYBT9623_00707 [Dyadobacter sp. CECT 9623]|uniref:Uncharacterized protein n=1 Tax=Dyadobacter linearis TaxID=2823330 RepID=A0ABM8UKJ1_9BACT|nr:hypothetical protein DYBT9623_00707 [Dyadobacter sp. CECT 9623]
MRQMLGNEFLTLRRLYSGSGYKSPSTKVEGLFAIRLCQDFARESVLGEKACLN